jgi:hypothetical protein
MFVFSSEMCRCYEQDSIEIEIQHGEQAHDLHMALSSVKDL